MSPMDNSHLMIEVHEYTEPYSDSAIFHNFNPSLIGLKYRSVQQISSIVYRKSKDIPARCNFLSFYHHNNSLEE